ncbi:hypothetical protein TIFTF001_021199 [Ficus carica]|uniref:Ribulose bisphosphate carboxylase small subunit domain-containing protein n=1 Tax=Ficus carica TaxID=3494 RepID=A0AA88AHI6_FICCA|nr:hypothetical protein TIFTF001_021199 [Ficus carica]
MSAGTFTTPVAGFGYAGLKSGFPKPLVAAKDSVAWTRKTVSNGSKTHCMKVTSSYQVMSQTTFAVIKLIGLLSPGIWVAAFRFRIRECFHFSQFLIPRDLDNGSRSWNPINNKKFETLSYLPPPSDDSIAKEIDYMIKNGWIPCLEFDEIVGSIMSYFSYNSSPSLPPVIV